ncbi:MAG TPA: tryptophan synthase subunit alpha [Opitutaceae bacterium]|jgi:tryptophan synthase alpha chain
MSRIADAFARARSANRAAFIAYLCAGDPDFETSLAACRAVIDAGTDILELGMPFSDPLADGIANQLAAQRALESGMTTAKVFELVSRLRETSAVPIVLYVYYNLVFANGIEKFVRAARAAGVDGLLTLDLPPEEARDLNDAAKAAGLEIVSLVAPTTPESRLPVIASAASGFIYYVSREGVTGVRDQVAAGIREAVNRIRKHTDLPVAVGFGIARREHVTEVAAAADGVVVGSALVSVVQQHAHDRPKIAPELRKRAADLVAGTARIP